MVQNVVNLVFSLNEKTLAQVNIISYLGATLTADDKCECDIKSRIGKSKQPLWHEEDTKR